MPPRIERGSSGRGGRGGGRGGGSSGGSHRGGASSQMSRATSVASSEFRISDHVETIGARRPGFGKQGKPVSIYVNSFETTVPQTIIRHYDVVISPSEQTLPARLNMEIITALQTRAAPNVFTPPAVYDGRKNMFAARELPLTTGSDGTAMQEFSVTLSDEAPGKKAPKVYKVRLTKVAQINPEVLARFVKGNQSHDNVVLTAITALNVVIRMEPTLKYPFNVRSFFTDKGKQDIGGGLEVWRGYFQSVRPGMEKLFINVDISTGLMYKSGPLIDLCLDFIGKRHPDFLAPAKGFSDRDRNRLYRFIAGLRVIVRGSDTNGSQRSHVVKRISDTGANALSFQLRENGESIMVADYFKRNNRGLQFPHVVCVQVGAGAYIPLEVCVVPPGQIIRKQVPPEKTKDVLTFATKKPQDRLQSIKEGVNVLSYGQSEYVRQFGMDVKVANGPTRIQARILPAPILKYGPGSKQATIAPRNGAWNMVDKKFMKPATVVNWFVVIYEQRDRFPPPAARSLVAGLVEGCMASGMRIEVNDPHIAYENGQGNIANQLQQNGMKAAQKKGGPNLIVVVLPETGNDIYVAVKHFGDCVRGVATQCVKASKANRAKPQYWANVALKINVKLGGINLIPDPSSVAVLTDPHNPTVVMGADVVHPAPGSEGKPSFTSLVSSVDADTAKYVATSRVQTSRQEMIEDLGEMVETNLRLYTQYREKFEPANKRPLSRIIFYRDGVSEGQFAQVLEQELPRIRAAAERLNMKPKITVIVVGKRHHVRFFPGSDADQDKSGNCIAGTVVDSVIAHPTEFDFYLQSHGGLLGTSRSAHYSVLYDENKFSADALQTLSFALCHVYARSTRSVSIPAPVYYADIVCARARNHYDPSGSVNLSDTVSSGGTANQDVTLESYRKGFKPLHKNQQIMMYFS